MRDIEPPEQTPDTASPTTAAGPAGTRSVKGLYVHIPYCERKCSYCAFYVTTRDREQTDSFIDAIEIELKNFPQLEALETIYLGGGTPSMLTTEQLARLCGSIRENVPWQDGVEWSIESNPGTYTPEKVSVLADAGVNRVSIGGQSFDDTMLRRLSRTHSAADIVETAEIVRGAGIRNINLDLIASIPGINRDTWLTTLGRTIDLQPEHVSVYALSLDEGSALARLAGLGRYELSDDEDQLDALHAAREMLSAAGLAPYEISNFAREGDRCRHNLSCWRGEDYIGLGPSAASRIGGTRWSNVADLGSYIEQVHATGAPEREIETLAPREAAAERLAFGVRMTDGVPSRWTDGFEAAITELESHGLLEYDSNRVRLTARGRDLADTVAREILSCGQHK